jgi:hypothetical protein
VDQPDGSRVDAGSVDDDAGWERLEERRTYGGDTHEAAVVASGAGVNEALRQGYIPDRIAWSDDGRSVTIDYVYDPKNSPRAL